MPTLDRPFNVNEAPEPEDWTPIPKGTEAIAEVEESQIVSNENGWKGVRLVWCILDGDYKNRKVKQQITIECNNAQAVEIGARQLRQVCEACKLATLTQTEELHGKPCLIKIGQENPNSEGDIYNNVKTVKGYNGQAPAPVTPPPKQAPTAKPATGKKPWEK